jgi:hypothetical protein
LYVEESQVGTPTPTHLRHFWMNLLGGPLPVDAGPLR